MTNIQKNALQYLLDGIVDEHRLSVFDTKNFHDLLNTAYEMHKSNLKKAYEEGYDAAFHHEESNFEKWYIENF